MTSTFGAMQPSWQSVIEIAGFVSGPVLAMMVDLWLFATQPSRRLLLSLAAWMAGALLMIAPYAILGGQPGFLFATPILGATFWGAIELRRRWNDWLWREWPAKQRQEDEFRSSKPTSFDG